MWNVLFAEEEVEDESRRRRRRRRRMGIGMGMRPELKSCIIKNFAYAATRRA
jgi:hypothetical protein